jgi:hypothetical protein
MYVDIHGLSVFVKPIPPTAVGMWWRFAAPVAALAAVAVATGACAMNAPAAHGRCIVVGAGKLPGEVSSGSICAAVERHIAAVAPAARYSVEVKVLSASGLATTLIVDGRQLPEQKFGVMDRNLSATTVERFAQGIANAVAEAAKR